MRVRYLGAVLLFTAVTAVGAVSELGTYAEFVPESQASESAFGVGLVAVVLQWTDEDHIRPTFVTRSAEEFVRQYLLLPAEIQEHGIWLTLAEHDRYSSEEVAVLRDFDRRCRDSKILAFVRTGRHSEDWQQISGEAPK